MVDHSTDLLTHDIKTEASALGADFCGIANADRFEDADTVISGDVLTSTLQSIRDGAVGGGAAFRFDGRVPLYGKVLQWVVFDKQLDHASHHDLLPLSTSRSWTAHRSAKAFSVRPVLRV